MKITPKQEQAFLDKDYAHYNAILIFGSDSSLVLDRISTLSKKIILNEDDELVSKITLDYQEILEDKSILQHELQAIGLFSSSKVILIENITKALPSQIKELLLESDTNHLIIFKANELTPSSSIRKFFETEKKLAAIHCYQTDSSSSKTLLLKKLSEHELQLNSRLIEIIASQIRGEYSTIVSEIDKVIHFIKCNESISEKDINSIISKPSEKNSYDPFIHSIVTSRFSDTEQELEKLLSSGIHFVAITRNLANYFVKVLKAKIMIKQRSSEKDAIDSIRPTIFFKNVPIFKTALRKYSIRKIANIIFELTQLEADYKSHNIPPAILWEKLYYKLFIEVEPTHN